MQTGMCTDWPSVADPILLLSVVAFARSIVQQQWASFSSARVGNRLVLILCACVGVQASCQFVRSCTEVGILFEEVTITAAPLRRFSSACVGGCPATIVSAGVTVIRLGNETVHRTHAAKWLEGRLASSDGFADDSLLRVRALLRPVVAGKHRPSPTAVATGGDLPAGAWQHHGP